MLDLCIKNANVIDGTGSPAVRADVGIKDGMIITDPREEAKKEIDAAGRTLCPGFIDSHSHMDVLLGTLTETACRCKVTQGVTTEVGGQCGSTLFPRKMSIDDYFDLAERAPKAGNYALLAGHGAIREAVMDCRSGPPTADEMRAMKDFTARAMEKGCFGLSSGLIYIPGVFADAEELIELCRVIRPYGGTYATHMRSEADQILTALGEAIRIAREADVPLFISHHKVMGVRNHGKSVNTLSMIHDAIRNGLKISMDQYPYEATESSLSNSVPPSYFTDGREALAEKLKDPSVRADIRAAMTAPEPGYNCGYRNAGGWDRIMIASAFATPYADGRTVAEIAEDAGKDPFDIFFDLLVENKCDVHATFFSVGEEDIERIYLDENTCVGSDGMFRSEEDHPHPRAYGTFARSLRIFWREKKLVTLEEAVRKQTGLTAERWGLAGKGFIKEGYDADLVLFSPDEITDRATYAQPVQTCAGIDAVYVAGKEVLRGGRMTGETPGRILYRRG